MRSNQILSALLSVVISASTVAYGQEKYSASVYIGGADSRPNSISEALLIPDYINIEGGGLKSPETIVLTKGFLATVPNERFADLVAKALNDNSISLDDLIILKNHRATAIEDVAAVVSKITSTPSANVPTALAIKSVVVMGDYDYLKSHRGSAAPGMARDIIDIRLFGSGIASTGLELPWHELSGKLVSGHERVANLLAQALKNKVIGLSDLGVLEKPRLRKNADRVAGIFARIEASGLKNRYVALAVSAPIRGDENGSYKDYVFTSANGMETRLFGLGFPDEGLPVKMNPLIGESIEALTSSMVDALEKGRISYKEVVSIANGDVSKGYGLKGIDSKDIAVLLAKATKSASSNLLSCKQFYGN